eukprot:CAMPEP_0194491374 /NCGR_PEP_ID=MMETSP0253-20130528/10279_1 /TAXON_ID=2966 /ORGANISM="Noctiluca scintillans" /LENGTH=412 /DNA_ID=CAMNT_0039332101 /DNA_START=139 /DNA_END=1377 /DNA_ORIENTATION=-
MEILAALFCAALLHIMSPWAVTLLVAPSWLKETYSQEARHRRERELEAIRNGALTHPEPPADSLGWGTHSNASSSPSEKSSPSSDSEEISECVHVLGTIKSYSAVREYGFIVLDGLEEDIWFRKCDVEQDDLCAVRPGAAVKFAKYEREISGHVRARLLELTFEGTLKWYDRLHSYGFIHFKQDDSEEGTDVWFALSDLVTPTAWLIEGVSVRFDLYVPGSGRSRGRRVRVERPPAWTAVTEGYVKFYLRDRGHGFIVCEYEGLEGDVWFSQDDVPERHHSRLTAGVPVRFWLERQEARARARDVEIILEPAMDGRVKSYSDQKGYGFVSCPSLEQDVWFASACVQNARPNHPLGPGMFVRVEMFRTEDGKVRAYSVERLPNKTEQNSRKGPTDSAEERSLSSQSSHSTNVP